MQNKQPSNTSARKQRQTARPRCLVDRGTPLLSRADSNSSFRPGISTSPNPWRFTVALRPSPAMHHTHFTCLCSILHHAVTPKSSRSAAHESRQDQRITIRQIRNIYYMTLTLINIIYMWYCGFHCYNPIVSHNNNNNNNKEILIRACIHFRYLIAMS